MMESSLSKQQIRELKGKAQRMDATLRLGKQGLSEAFLKSLGEAFDRLQLVKIKFDASKDQKANLVEEMIAKTGCHFVQQVGHVVVLFRQKQVET